MAWEHYLFGELKSFQSPPDLGFVEEVLDRAEAVRGILPSIDIRHILDLLDRVGRLWSHPDYAPRRLAIRHLPEVVGFSPQMVERGLDELGRLLSRQNLLEMLRFELGTLEPLDRWTWKPGYNGYIRGLPLGVVLHVSPGNVFLGAVDSLLRGLLTKNTNILKVSSADPIFPLLFAQTLAEQDHEGRIAGSFAIVSFRGGEEDLEARFKARCQGTVVWGGEKALQAWGRDLPVGNRLVPYGPRMSLAVITRDWLDKANLTEAAVALATDVAMWEQRGCGSPQMLFLEDSGPCGEDFLSALRQALDDLAFRLPPARLSLDEKVEILRERELARFGELTGSSRAWFPEGDNRWTVLWRQATDRLGSPLNRTVVVHPYTSWAEVLEALAPYREVLQSVGLGARGSALRDLSADLVGLGATRITEIGRMHSSKAGSPHDGSFQLDRLLRWVSIESVAERFDATEQVDPGTKAPTRSQRLMDLVRFARDLSPFYRTSLGEAPIQNHSDIQRLPLLTGEEVRQNTPPAGHGLLTGPLQGAYVFASGGSTGAPKFSFYSYEEWEEVTDTMAAIYSIAGIGSGDTVGNLFMAGSLYTSFLAANEALEKLGCVSLPIAGNAELNQIMRYLELFRPTAILGLPSVLVQIAETVERHGLDLKISKILYGGEHLSREAKTYLRERLGADVVLSAGYASVDAGPVGYQCPFRPGGVHHLLYDYQYLEILDPETGRPVPEGEVGEIVVTCLKRRLMPLIRYRTGDLGRRVGEQCPCGRTTPLFELKGRTGDVLRVGTVSIYPDSIAAALSQVQGTSHLFQIVADRTGAKDVLTIRTERLHHGDPDRSGEIRQAILNENPELPEALAEGWLAALEVEVLEPDGLPRNERTGKIQRAVDRRT
jgi:phenylacetate-coenzyme A ligase PaaK-like adenylate-forming protein